jgi:hypothetical protein
MPTAPARKSRRRPVMTAQHREALAVGRNEGRHIRRYLDYLANHQPKRGRKPLPATIQRRMAQIDRRLKKADELTAVRLRQEKLDLAVELAGLKAKPDVAELEQGFVKVAASYSERKGISYAAWREAGVPAAVLKRAGIRRGSGSQ